MGSKTITGNYQETVVSKVFTSFDKQEQGGILFVTGEVKSGRTTFIRELASHAVKSNKNVVSVDQGEVVVDFDGMSPFEHTVFSLEDVNSLEDKLNFTAAYLFLEATKSAFGSLDDLVMSLHEQSKTGHKSVVVISKKDMESVEYLLTDTDTVLTLVDGIPQ